MTKRFLTRKILRQRKRILRDRRGNPLERMLRQLHWADKQFLTNGPNKAVMVLDPCVYCGRPANSWDHLDPVAKGGNDRCNLARSCHRCNKSKYATPLLRYLVERAWRIRRHRERRITPNVAQMSA